MKQFQECTLLISAPDKASWPPTALPEIVLAGRSNVGKSSFINTMTNRKKLAYVGNTPGKTRLLNFFQLDKELIFVDVPGYGFANLSKQQLLQFGEMMEDYFHHRTQKKGLVLLVDARRIPNEDDTLMMEFARYYKMHVLVVATKIDKLKRNEMLKNMNVIQDVLQLQKEELVAFSSVCKEGIKEAWLQIEKMYKE
ncbi:MAG: ribosome biogenesis GTP-binding protein YihA/YsxC [Breznakia sp.]